MRYKPHPLLETHLVLISTPETLAPDVTVTMGGHRASTANVVRGTKTTRWASVHLSKMGWAKATMPTKLPTRESGLSRMSLENLKSGSGGGGVGNSLEEEGEEGASMDEAGLILV